MRLSEQIIAKTARQRKSQRQAPKAFIVVITTTSCFSASFCFFFLFFLFKSLSSSCLLYRSLLNHSATLLFVSVLHLRLSHCRNIGRVRLRVIVQPPITVSVRHRTNRFERSHWEIDSHQKRVLELSDLLVVSLLAVDCHRAAKAPVNCATFIL